MQTTRAVLNDRTKKKTSNFHKICTYEHSTPYFHSDTPHGYEFSHIKSSPGQLVFHKQEVRPTPISLPTPPASPEFYGTSLQKWYQKKPLFTLTAKGQVKRLEKYLQIQKTLEICKREYEFQIHTENMKKAYVDFEFREHQPFLYAAKNSCSSCSSPKSCDIGFKAFDYRPYSSSPSESCTCSDEYDDEEPEKHNPSFFENSYFFNFPVEVKSNKTPCESQISDLVPEYASPSSNIDEKLVPSQVIKEGTCNSDDCGIFKIVVRNKDSLKAPEKKRLCKLFTNKNFAENGESVDYSKSNEVQESDHENGNAKQFRMAKITLDNVASFPFDNINGKCNSSGYLKNKSGENLKYLCSSAPTKYTLSSKKTYTTYKQKYDINKNEVYYM